MEDTEQLNEIINQLRFEVDLLKKVNANLTNGRDKISEAANSLGYQFDPQVSVIDYVINLANKSANNDQNNIEAAERLMQTLIECRKSIDGTLEKFDETLIYIRDS